MSGYVLSHRDVYRHPVFKNHIEACAFVWMYHQACWRDAIVKYKGKRLGLKRGQLAISTRDLADMHDWSEAKARRYLSRLATDAMIDARTDAGVTIVSIRNYDKYQSLAQASDAPSDAPSDAAATQQRRSSDAQNNKENEDKELKEQKEGAVAPAGKYAFEGKTARLTERDFGQWCRSYAGGNRERLMAWMQERDDWLSSSRATDADRKAWFHSTSSWLRRKSQEYSEKAERTAAQKNRDRPMVKMSTAEMDLLMSGEVKL